MPKPTANTYHLAGCKHKIFSSSSDHETIEQADLYDFSYLESALVPRIDKNDEFTQSKAYSNVKFRSGIDILIGNYPSFNDAQKQCVSEITASIAQGLPFVPGNEFQEIINQFTEFLKRISQDSTKPVDTRTLVYPPGLPTTTGSYSDNLFLGMHLDNIDHQHLEDRKSRRQRMLLNISSEPRVFLYGDLPYESFEYMDENSTSQLMATDHFDIGTTRYFYLAPFEYCIAPTETLFHDGSTWFCEEAVLTLTGLFNPNFNKLVTN